MTRHGPLSDSTARGQRVHAFTDRSLTGSEPPRDGSVPDEELLDLVDHSYELVIAKLPNRMQSEPMKERR